MCTVQTHSKRRESNKQQPQKTHRNYENCKGRKSGRVHQTRTDSINGKREREKMNWIQCCRTSHCVLTFCAAKKQSSKHEYKWKLKSLSRPLPQTITFKRNVPLTAISICIHSVVVTFHKLLYDIIHITSIMTWCENENYAKSKKKSRSIIPKMNKSMKYYDAWNNLLLTVFFARRSFTLTAAAEMRVRPIFLLLWKAFFSLLCTSSDEFLPVCCVVHVYF